MVVYKNAECTHSYDETYIHLTFQDFYRKAGKIFTRITT